MKPDKTPFDRESFLDPGDRMKTDSKEFVRMIPFVRVKWLRGSGLCLSIFFSLYSENDHRP